MKRNFFTKAITRTSAALFAAALCVSCNVDDSYDLSNLESDGIGVGTDETEFNLPVATVNVDLASFLGIEDGTVPAGSMVTRSTPDYSTIIGNIDDLSALMPTGDAIDLTQLNDVEYVGGVVGTLVEELKTSPEKCESLCETLVSGEDGEYDNILDAVNDIIEDEGLTLSAGSTPEDITEIAGLLNNSLQEADTTTLQSEITTVVTDSNLAIEDVVVSEEITELEIDQDTIDLITENLDGTNNKIFLHVSYVYNLPIAITVETTISYKMEDGVDKDLTLTEVGYEAERDVDKDALNTILSGFTLNTTVKFDTYTSTGTSLMETLKNEKLVVNLVVKKTGSLKF